jgi:hypothetical protein
MIDQYISTTECARRLSERIPDREVAGNPAGLSESPEVGDRLEAGHRLYRQKHERAVALLYAMFCDGTLSAFIRGKFGLLVALIDSDWKAMAFWHEVILGGKIRHVGASAGERALEPYDECDVLVPVQSFQEWLDRRYPLPELPAEPSPAEPASTATIQPVTTTTSTVTPFVEGIIAAFAKLGYDPHTVGEKKVLAEIQPHKKCGMSSLETALKEHRHRLGLPPRPRRRSRQQ